MIRAGAWLATLLALAGPSVSRAWACADFAAAPGTRWQVAARDGVAWLVTPCGDRFFSVGVNVVDGGFPERLFRGRVAYHWSAFFPDRTAWITSTRGRLFGWGFNTVGGWSLPPRLVELPSVPNLSLGVLAKFHWGDPFAPEVPARMTALARELVAPYAADARRIGYFPDNEVGWWGGALFTWYVKQGAASHTKRRLVALARRHYGGDWRRFARDFDCPPGMRSFAALRRAEGAVPRLRPGGDGIQLVRRWTAAVAGRYYRVVRRALAAADPAALVFSDRLPIYYDPVAVRAMAPYVDAVATNYNVDSPDGWIARYYFDGLRALTGGKPVLVSEWFFAADENRTGNRNNGHLMTVATQAARAAGAAAAAARFAREPEVVGLHWFQYYDHPRGGRGDGEDYNFGLVDVDDRPYDELVGTFGRLNPRLAALHADAARSPAGAERPAEIPHAEIDATDRSLADWPKEAALVRGMRAPAPEVPFGDVYLAWSAAGLHVALIGMDYYDPALLAYEGDFPRGEAFRLALGLDGGAGTRQFALHFVPPRHFPRRGAPMMRAELCRVDGGTCASVPGGVATYFGSDQPRITAEATLPWAALGMRSAPANLGVEVVLVAFHRARWTSSGGLPPDEGLTNQAGWRRVKLAGVRR